MEVDFSDQIKEFFCFEAKANAGRGPEFTKKTLEEKVCAALQKKVDEHNSKKQAIEVSIAQLKTVYRRGLQATASNLVCGENANSWCMARVNMFLKMMDGQKVAPEYRLADQDIAEGEALYYEQKPEDCFWGFNKIDFDLARIDLLKANVDLVAEGDIHLDDLDYTDIEKQTLNKAFYLDVAKANLGVFVKNKRGETVLAEFKGLDVLEKDLVDLKSLLEINANLAEKL